MRSVTATCAVAFMVLLLTTTATTSALGASEHQGSTSSTGQAQFEGHQINLQRGWGDARTCVVWNEDGETDCFRSEAAADAAVDRRERAEAGARTRAAGIDLAVATRTRDRVPPATGRAQLVSVCSSWLYLYEHNGYGGRSLRFRDVGTTQDLADWGFASQTSSYRVGACPVTLRDAAGTVYPGWTGAHASSSSMVSGWNDRVRYLRIS